jgi:hypothetical protein
MKQRRQKMSSLTVREINLFFNLWLGLLAYVNDKYGIVNDFGHPQKPQGLNLSDVTQLKDKLWEHAGLIDEYINSVWDMPNEHMQILKGWKKGIAGTFFILKHLKKYSVFLDDKNKALYGVKGITDPISDIAKTPMLPLIVETVLLPFGDQIIYDSLLYTQNISFGSGIRRELNEVYSEIKQEKGIITRLN